MAESIKTNFLSEAIFALSGECAYDSDGKTILKWNQSDKDQPDQKDIDAKIVELKEDYDSQAYARSRRPQYPTIGDQLDDLYKKGAFSTSMAAKIKKVKDDNPKG